MCMWRKLTWTLTPHPPQPSDVTSDVHVTQVNMNVNIPTPEPSDVTWMCMWRIKYVCFRKRPKRWRGFPSAGINMCCNLRGQKVWSNGAYIYIYLTSHDLWIILHHFASSRDQRLSKYTWRRGQVSGEKTCGRGVLHGPYLVVLLTY